MDYKKAIWFGLDFIFPPPPPPNYRSHSASSPRQILLFQDDRVTHPQKYNPGTVSRFQLVTATTHYTVLERDYKIPTTTTPKNQVVPAILAWKLLNNHMPILEIQFRNNLGFLSKLIEQRLQNSR